MGAKRPSWTTEDPLQLPSGLDTPDRGYQSDEWVNREGRPRASPKIYSDREREVEWRRVREMDKIRDIPRGGRRETEQDQRDRDRYKSRAGETEWRERDRRREDGRHANKRIASAQECRDEYREMGRGKGDTFPRTRRKSNERERPRHSFAEESDRMLERGMGRPRELSESERERERERARRTDRDIQRYREMERQREIYRAKIREEMKRNGERKETEESDRMKERGLDLGRRDRRGERDREVNDQQVMRTREVERVRDGPGHQDRENWFYSVQKRRLMEGERENFSDREEWNERSRPDKREKHRHTKSEGDSDEDSGKDIRREQETVGFRGERRKSEQDNEERIKERLREKEKRRDIEMQRERDRGKQRQKDTLESRGREKDREWMTDRYKERYRERDLRERDWVKEGRGPDRQTDGARGTQDRRDREVSERMRRDYERERARPYERERQRSWEDGERVRSIPTQEEANRKMQEEARSSRERMSGCDVENDQWKRRIRESFEDQEKESTSESSREKRRSEEGQDVAREQLLEGEAKGGFQKEELETVADKERQNSENKQRWRRKMWLEPRSERDRTETLEGQFRERESAKERYAQRYKTVRDEEKTSADVTYERAKTLPEERLSNRVEEIMKYRERENVEEGRDEAMETAFESKARSDRPWQSEAENVADKTKRSDREEERGSDRYDESEGEWEEGRGRVTSGDDDFVTVSSGEEEEAEDDKFEDCTEFWDPGVREDVTRQASLGTHQREGGIEPRMTKERSDRTVTVFCVVGQTLPRSGANHNKLMDQMEQEEASQNPRRNISNGDELQEPAPFIDAESTEDPETESYTVEHTSVVEQKCPGHDLGVSEEEYTSWRDSTWEKAEFDKITKEITSPEDPDVTSSVATEKHTELHPLEPCETSTHTKDTEQRERQMERHQLEETWSTSPHIKRYSAEPHVKWAKNVLSEILGSSEDGMVDVSKENSHTRQPGEEALTEAERQEGRGSPASPAYGIIDKTHKHDREKKCADPEQVRTEDTEMKADTLIGDKILIQVEGDSESEDVMEPLDLEKEWLEGASNEDADSDRIFPSPLSSDVEAERDTESKKKEKKKKKGVWSILSSGSFQELGTEARIRRRGFRKMEKEQEKEEGEVLGRDRRTRVFTSEDEYDELRSSWNEAELSNFKNKIRTKMRTSKYYNSQLYQQYNEVAQNREILHQSNSDASVFGEVGSLPPSPTAFPSPPLARRPLPPLPSTLHPHSLKGTNSSSSVSETLAVPRQAVQKAPSPRLSRSFASSPMLWQDIPGVTNNPDLKNFSENERRLQEVRFEVVTSEASYCSSVDIVVEHFVKSKQLNAHLTTQDKNWLFSRLSDVKSLSHSFLSQLEERVESDPMHFTVCDIIVKHCPRFRLVYVPYLTNQSYQDKTYQRLMNENAGFRQVVEKLEHSPKCQRLPFRSFLILPFQRITRLKLLVQNILKRTAPKTKDEAQAIKAMKLLEKMIQESNDSISQMKSIESLVSLNAKVDFECKTLPLISQSRRLVREGQLTELRDFSLKETERHVYMHLFNDYLLLSVPREGGRFTVIDHAPVSELRAENCRVKLHSLQKNLFRLHLSSKALLLRTDTQADKLRWISALSRPHPEIDLNAAQDIPQMQCIRAFVAQQPDELSVEKADVLLVHQLSNDGWVEGTRLSDRHRGWVPESHLETIVSEKARQQNLVDTLKITTATATV